jgi:hypothetical protein
MRWHRRAPQDWKGRPSHSISSWLRFVEKVSSGERSTGFSAYGQAGIKIWARRVIFSFTFLGPV